MPRPGVNLVLEIADLDVSAFPFVLDQTITGADVSALLRSKSRPRPTRRT